MMKENLFLLTGAGFSTALLSNKLFKNKCLSTSFFTSSITDLSIAKLWCDNLDGFSFSDNERIFSLCKLIQKKIKNANSGVQSNFESIIYYYEKLTNYIDKTSFTGKEKYLEEVFFSIKSDFIKFYPKYNDVIFLKTYILAIARNWELDNKHNKSLSSFFSSLLDNNNLKYYTLNYDSLAWRCFQNYFSSKNVSILSTVSTGALYGLSASEIKSEYILNHYYKTSMQHSYCHLHGSVLYSIGSTPDTLTFSPDNPKFKQPLLREITESLNYLIKKRNDDGSFSFFSEMITGLNKESSIKLEPYASILNKCFLEYYQADKAIIIGYSFSDDHINNLIRCINPNLKKIIIIDKIEDKDEQEKFVTKVWNTINNNLPLQKDNKMFPIFHNGHPVKDNVWYFETKNDNLKLEIHFNGTVEFVEKTKTTTY